MNSVRGAGRRPFLTAEWRHLVIFSYAVPPSLLRPFVPRGTELDAWNGNVYVSLVGFLFLNTKVLGVAVPWHRSFEEVNLRFYVRRETNAELRRGVVFIKEIVPRRMIAWVARSLYNENYHATRMAHALDFAPDDARHPRRVRYSWGTGGAEVAMQVECMGEPQPLVPGSEEEFITEHYWGYTRQRDGSTLEYEVTHPAWRTSRARETLVEGDASHHYGPEFGEIVRRRPDSFIVADGSPVAVFHGRRLT